MLHMTNNKFSSGNRKCQISYAVKTMSSSATPSEKLDKKRGCFNHFLKSQYVYDLSLLVIYSFCGLAKF